MAIIKLGSPRPLKVEKSYCEFKFPIIQREYLPKPFKKNHNDFFRIVINRRTRRDFGLLAESQLSTVLWYTSHVKYLSKEQGRIISQKRPVPSAGGRHPIDLLIVAPTDEGWSASVYDPFAHCLCYLDIDSYVLEELLMDVDSVVAIQQATLIWFIAQPDRTMSKYTNSTSLIWRDAGVLQGQFSLVAESLNLSCCLLGITGDKFINKLFSSKGKLVGMGGCLIGNRVIQE